MIQIKEHSQCLAYGGPMEWAIEASEAERLRALAEWYRGWALVANDEADRAARLGLAKYIDAQARGAENGSATG